MLLQHIRGWFVNRTDSAPPRKRRLILECLEDRLCPSNIAIITQPANQTVAVNSSVTLAAAATGNPAPTVQWQESIDNGTTFNNIAGATTGTYTFTAPATPAVDLFRAVFTNTTGQLDTRAARVTVDVPPTVSTNPAPETVNAGSTATFTVAGAGTPAPSVQWQVSRDHGKHFENIPFANTDTLTFKGRPGQDGDEFRAVFKNAVGTAVTSAATLTVDFAPSIDKQPHSQTVAVGSSVTLTATADGDPAPTVQWYSSTDGGKTFNAVAGATSDTFKFTASTTAGTTLYEAIFTNSVGTATTHAATITADVPPTVTTNPVNAEVIAGNTVTFTAAATGTPTPRVQWQISTDGGKHFSNIPSANLPTLTFTARPGQNTDEFRAVFTDPVGRATTAAATLTVDFLIMPPPPVHTVATGSQFTLTVQDNGNPPPTVQWFISTDHGATFTAVPGATSATYTFTAPSTPQVDLYKAVLTNSVGSLTSPIFTVVVDAPPVVTTSPLSQTINAGSTVTFTAAASGTPAPRVQWQVSTDGGQHFTNIRLANTDTLTFKATASQNGDEFRAVFTNPVGRVTTANALLTVDFGPTVTMQPNDQTVATGSTVTLSAGANSNPAPTVQWYSSIDGGSTFTPITGATLNTYSFNAGSTAGSSVYRAIFTNALGTATTRQATITVDIPPTVTLNPTSESVTRGGTVTFTAGGGGTPAGTVQWQVSRDGGKHFQNIAFANTDTLTFTAKADQNGDQFRAVFTNPVGQATTSVAILTVSTPVT
jgi:hypothetical protein